MATASFGLSTGSPSTSGTLGVGGFGSFGAPSPVSPAYPSSSALGAVGTVPQAQFPSWFQQSAPTQALTNFQSQLPNYFNFGAMNKTFNNSNASMLAGQRSAAGAAAAAQTNRAMQTGGSPLGAGFAQGQMNQNAYNQSQANQLRFQQFKAGLRGQEAGLAGNVAGQISSLGEQHQGLMANYAQGQQGLGLQAQGQTLSQLGLAQSGQQANNAFSLAYAQFLKSQQGGSGPGSMGGFNGQLTGIGDTGGAQYTPQFKAYLQASGQGLSASQPPPNSTNPAGYNMGGSVNAFNSYNQGLGQIAGMANGMPWYDQQINQGGQPYNSTNITAFSSNPGYPGGIPYASPGGQTPNMLTPGGYGASLNYGNTPTLQH